MKRMMLKYLLLLLVASLGGCGTLTVSDPARTATEQLLISTACERAVAQFETDGVLEGKKVFLDFSRFTSYDKEFATSEIRNFFASKGAALVASQPDSELSVEVRAGALSINRRDWLFGMPSIMLPGALSLPALPLIRTIEQKGVGKLAFYVYETSTGRYVLGGGPYVGKARRKHWWLFGLGLGRSGDIAD